MQSHGQSREENGPERQKEENEEEAEIGETSLAYSESEYKDIHSISVSNTSQNPAIESKLHVFGCVELHRVSLNLCHGNCAETVQIHTGNSEK